MLNMLIAYGGLSGDPLEDFLEVMFVAVPNFFFVWGMGLAVYLLGKRSTRYMVYSMLAFYPALLLTPPLVVMGAYGSRHIAFEMINVNKIGTAFFVILIPAFNYFGKKSEHNKKADPGGSA